MFGAFEFLSFEIV